MVEKTRNQFDGNVTWVRIPSSPPEVHRNVDRITVDFFYARKPHEIKVSAVPEHKRTSPRSDSAAGFSAFFGFYGGLSESKR